MAQVPTSIPMSPNGETSNAPLVEVTTLQPQDPATVVKNTADASEDAPPVTNGSAAVETQHAETSIALPAVNSDTSIKSTGLVVHHLNSSRSQRLLWLLEELEVPYEIKKYERAADLRAPKELKAVHSLGKSPIITHGDLTLAESGAITEYLISKYGENFRPIESGKIDDLYFTHYAEGSFMPILVNKLIFSIVPQRSPVLIRPLIKPIFATLEKRMLDPELKAHCAMIESHLEKCETGWLAGGDYPTSADFMMAFPIEMLLQQGAAFVGPKMKKYVERVQERPAYKRGLEKGGEHAYAKL